MATTEAALLCGICDESYTSNLKALPCGHVLCDKCYALMQSTNMRSRCPYCRYEMSAREGPYPIFPDLRVVDHKDVSTIIEQTRQRVDHLYDGLGSTLSVEQLREIYNEARIQRSEVRNIASGSGNDDLKALAIALTHAIDILEDQLLHALESDGSAAKARDAKKKLNDQKVKHEQETKKLKKRIDDLNTRLKDGEEERKQMGTKVTKYKERVAGLVIGQEAMAKKAEEMAKGVEDMTKELAKTKSEWQLFQSQLHEHKINETKYKQQIRELKHEIKALKEQKLDIQPQSTIAPFLSQATMIELSDSSESPGQGVTSPLHTPARKPRGALEDSSGIINLVSSSPCRSSPTQPATHRKRPRAPDENHYRRSRDMTLLPPPKARAAGPSRTRDEVVEKVAVGTNGKTKRKPTTLTRSSRETNTLRAMQATSALKTKNPELCLGKNGNLVVIKTKKVRAV